jgi:hypothetical protein
MKPGESGDGNTPASKECCTRACKVCGTDGMMGQYYPPGTVEIQIVDAHEECAAKKGYLPADPWAECDL